MRQEIVERSVVLCGRFYTTSYILIHVLERLLSHYPEQVKGFHFHLVLDDRRDLKLAQGLLPKDQVTVWIQYLNLRPFQKDRNWPEETVRRWERLYGSPHLRCYIENERALEGRPEAVRWSYLFLHIKYFETLWQNIHPMLYISGAADGLNPWVAMQVFCRNGTPCLSFSPCRFGRRSFILDNPYEVLNIGRLYKEKLLTGLTADENKTAQSILKEYRTGEVKPMDHLAVQSKKRRAIPNPLSAFFLIRQAYGTDIGNSDLPLSKALGRALRARWTGLRNMLLSRRVVSTLPDGEKFFFFPLQYEPEISLATQGRGWTNQLDLICFISHSLPIDRWLYVKEHPSMLSGIRPAGFYRRIMALPRVRLISQRMSSYQIVPRAEAVLTITGTAGWETLMFQRPVVLFGHSFYEEFEEGVTRLNRVEELPGILRGLRDWSVPEQPLLAYIAAVLSQSREGIFIEPRVYPEVSDVVMGERNLDNIATVILDELARAAGV